MSCETQTIEALREAGQRPTPQRLMILSILRHTRGHLTANDILERVRKHYPFVDISTVYRTMGTLKDIGLISETDMGSGEYSYEWTLPESHHHLVCRECGSEVSLEHDYLKHIGERIEADYGFQAELDHFAIFGTCRDCREKASG